MAVGKPGTGRPRKSKAEVQQEFEKIETQVDSEKASVDLKADEAAKIREQEVKETVSEISVESVVQKIGGLGVEISKYLSDVSWRLMTGTNLLTSLREAVTIEKKELEKLHKFDIAKTAIDLLIEEYRQTKESLKKEMEEQRAVWVREQEEQENGAREQEEALKKQRTREKEEYEYQKMLERKKEENAYEEAQRTLERKNKEKQEAVEKSWAEREVALKAQEEELARLKKEESGFPARIKVEVDKEVANSLAREKNQHEQKILLLQKESETEKRVAELRIKSLEETVARQFSQIESLSNRLDEAKKQVQDIAIKAIEGASGARALSHVNQIAMEQAKTRSTPPI